MLRHLVYFFFIVLKKWYSLLLFDLICICKDCWLLLLIQQICRIRPHTYNMTQIHFLPVLICLIQCSPFQSINIPYRRITRTWQLPRHRMEHRSLLVLNHILVISLANIDFRTLVFVDCVRINVQLILFECSQRSGFTSYFTLIGVGIERFSLVWKLRWFHTLSRQNGFLFDKWNMFFFCFVLEQFWKW